MIAYQVSIFFKKDKKKSTICGISLSLFNQSLIIIKKLQGNYTMVLNILSFLFADSDSNFPLAVKHELGRNRVKKHNIIHIDRVS